jgi:TPR repeat protein
MTNIGEMYERGEGRTRDYVAAREWYERAWERGADKWAAYRLAQFYENGWGVDKSRAVANFWNSFASGRAAMCG